MTHKEDWAEIQISPAMLDEANDNVQKYNNYNIFCGKPLQKLAGELGRLALRIYLLDHEIEFIEDTTIGSRDEFDFIINGRLVSLKTQKIQFPPREDWRCEVNGQQINNSCYYYLFAKVDILKQVAWLVGCIEKARFDKESQLHEKGSILTSIKSSWKVKETKRDVLISQLDTLDGCYCPVTNIINGQLRLRLFKFL